MQVSHPFRPSPRLPSARPRRAAHPLPRCARSRHGRRPPRSPPLRAAGAQPRAGHLHIHPGEANGPNSNTAPLPGGRRVHLGSACWGGRRCAMSCRHSPRGVGGRASGGSSLLVSRAAAAPFIWPLVGDGGTAQCLWHSAVGTRGTAPLSALAGCGTGPRRGRSGRVWQLLR